MAVNEDLLAYQHPLYHTFLGAKGLSVGLTTLDDLLNWGARSSLWVFPMATSCCGIELMAAAASRVDLDRMGTIVRATPRQADVMVVAGTITVKMAPRVRKLWDQMPEPKWCLAMGSCAISGDFYRDLYPVVPGIDTFLPVDVYVPGCPPNPEALMAGLLRLKEKIGKREAAQPREESPAGMIKPAIGRLGDPYRDPALVVEQEQAAMSTGDLTDVEDIPFPAAPVTVAPVSAEIQEVVGPATVEGPPLVEPARHVEVATKLVAAGYRLLAFLVGSHVGTDVEVAVGLRRPGRDASVASWRVRVPEGTPIPSLATLLPGADWQEREAFDLVGVKFEGHPDLRRILMPDDWKGHPLRKDSAADAPCRPWR